ncbi:MAG: hypothetical protein WCP86_01260, partial [bacterium]
SWEPLRWVGVRSYGIYLWHFPIFMITRPQLDVSIDGAPLMFTRLTLTLLIAALSYRFVETPIRQGALGRFWNTWVEAQGKRRLALGMQVAVTSLPVAVAGCALGLFLLNARAPAVPEYLSPVSTPATLKQDVITDHPLAVLQDMRIPVATSEAIQAPAPEAAVDTAITAIGDSVMLGVGEELKNTLSSNIVVDAEQGRLPWRTPAVVQKLRAENKINPIVILHVGNNGIFSAPVFDKLMAELKDVRKIVVVNVRVPRAWEIPNNAMLAEAVKRYPNAVLLDWKGASNDHPELFWKDGLHLRPAGARYYAALVSKLVDSDDPNRSTITIAGLVDTGRPHEQGWPSPNDAGRVRLLP